MRPTNEAPTSELSARFDFSRARRALLNWFKTNGRAFPWRDDPAPYRVWISEIMLQQTTTQTALGYFERFLERFPDVNALASASEEETLKYWEGLGYYRRARALRQAAIQIVERFHARFPSEYDDVLSLPGVGRYAAGAILSFGFDKRFPILEANTTRLHARLLALRSETSTSASQKLLWRFAEDWLPKDTSRRPKGLYRDINGALTDLGRLVCAPREPRCGVCPLAQFCESERLNLQNVVPVLKPKPEPIRRVDAAIVVFRADLDRADNVGEVEPRPETPLGADADVLLLRRPKGALWAGLWDFPRFDVLDPQAEELRDFSSDASLAERLQWFLEEEVGANPKDYRVGKALTTVRHAVTRYRVTLRVCQLADAKLRLPARSERPLLDLVEEPKRAAPRRTAPEQADVSTPQAEELRWVPIASLPDFPLSSPARRVAKYVAEKALKIFLPIK